MNPQQLSWKEYRKKLNYFGFTQKQLKDLDKMRKKLQLTKENKVVVEMVQDSVIITYLKRGNKKMSTKVYATTQFEGFHQWEDAPDEVAFLRNKHRHVFHVKAIVKTEEDREIEFFILQRKINMVITKFPKEALPSCEMMAEIIFDTLANEEMPVLEVEVNEDSENGAIYYEDYYED